MLIARPNVKQDVNRGITLTYFNTLPSSPLEMKKLPSGDHRTADTASRWWSNVFKRSHVVVSQMHISFSDDVTSRSSVGDQQRTPIGLGWPSNFAIRVNSRFEEEPKEAVYDNEEATVRRIVCRKTKGFTYAHHINKHLLVSAYTCQHEPVVAPSEIPHFVRVICAARKLNQRELRSMAGLVDQQRRRSRRLNKVWGRFGLTLKGLLEQDLHPAFGDH